MESLKKELARFNAIKKYTENLLSEQEAPLDPKAAVPPPPAGGVPPADPNAPPPVPPAGNEIPTADTDPSLDPDADKTDEKDTEVAKDITSDDTTEEIDMTDLVNMVKDVKKQIDATQGQDTGTTQKMNDVFSKLGELETKLGEMDNVLAKIDQLGAQIQQVKPKTPVEKLEMRSLDSYPFSKKPDEFFAEKQGDMKKSGKNEYVLTKGDVENYGKNEIMKSFNPQASENPYNY